MGVPHKKRPVTIAELREAANSFETVAKLYKDLADRAEAVGLEGLNVKNAPSLKTAKVKIRLTAMKQHMEGEEEINARKAQLALEAAKQQNADAHTQKEKKAANESQSNFVDEMLKGSKKPPKRPRG